MAGSFSSGESHASSYILFRDHCVFLVSLANSYRDCGRTVNRLWCFESLWVKLMDCETLIRDNWSKLVGGSESDVVWYHLEACKAELMGWSKLKYGNFNKKIKDVETQISVLRNRPILVVTKCMLSSLQ
ncbi:hypothetical protein Salat_1169300 [Sesamum alatum]|uniref:Uncharacterized protein n=1 Tax=Sesamum alatum TaxID=300844 RepID=A0AAE1YEC0_9LAMI|nr:hypothetical protein Salat_1169300 [Sesamum alatum]